MSERCSRIAEETCGCVLETERVTGAAEAQAAARTKMSLLLIHPGSDHTICSFSHTHS